MDLDWMRGLTLTRVFEHYPQNFTFEFGEATLAVDSFWRIVLDGRITVTQRDHKQQFGLPEPVDAQVEATKLLAGRKILGVRLQEDLGDLIIEFEGGQCLEVFNDSSGYEPWNLHAPGVHLVALGGGRVENFSPK